jgi:ribosomal protein S12 methylthiotransferase accessory factor YcaO
LQSDGFMVNFIDITTDLGIPVVLCAISRNDSLAANREMALGLGSRLCIHSAAEHALKEAVEQLVNYFKFSDAKIEYTERSCKLMEESTFDYFKFSHFLIANSVSSENRGGRSGEVSEAEELNFCMTRLWEKKLRIFYLDRTPKDLLSTSFRLIRVLVTKLQPHVYELDCNRLANARLYEAPVQMKVFTKPKSPGELNYRPDPYTFIQFSEAVK